MSSPKPGTILAGANVTFAWNPVSGASAYWLDVGTAQGQGNISGAQLASSITSATIIGIPTSGIIIYVRLWTMLNGAWQYHDYTYTAPTLASLVSPAPGSSLGGSAVTFIWTSVTGASAYWLDVGTAQGQGNISAGQLAPSLTSKVVSGIPINGNEIYVRLWTEINSVWKSQDYLYTAF